MKNNKKMIVGFLAPAVIIFLIVFLYPIVRTIMMSFFKIDSVTDTTGLWTFVGIQNYEKLFATAIFRKSMLNLFKIWAIGGAIVLSVSLLFGVILTSGIRGKKFFRAVIYLPNLVSAVALATMWLQYVYSSKFGLLKSILDAVGMHKLAETAWLDTGHKFGALLFAYCFGMIGYHMLIWMSGIERISPELYEAATIDGANRRQTFFHIVLPLIAPTGGIIAILCAINSLKVFDIVKTMTEGGPYYATDVIATYVYRTAFSSEIGMPRLGYASAAALFFGGAVIIIGILLNAMKDRLQKNVQ